MNNEQLDSQLSAMFDDELPEPECELLARRLARDEGLKARWGRYAVIAACIRMERGGEAAPAAAAARASGSQIEASTAEVRSAGGEARLQRIRLNGGVATRVSRMIAAEPPLLAGAGAGRNGRGLARPAMRRWWQPVAGGSAVAAGVAAAAILWLRAGSPDAPIVAQTTVLASAASAASAAAPSLMRPSGVVQIAARSANGPRAVQSRSAARSTTDSFVVPPPAPPSSFAPPVELANFVVVHSEYSMPLMRRSALSALVAAEPMTDVAAENPPASERSVSGTDDAGNAANAPHADHAQ